MQLGGKPALTAPERLAHIFDRCLPPGWRRTGRPRWRAGERAPLWRSRSAGPSRGLRGHPLVPAAAAAPGRTQQLCASGRIGSTPCPQDRSPLAALLPGCAGAQDPEHAVKYLPVILRRPARPRLLRRQQRGDLLPPRVGQLKASHPVHIGLANQPVNPFAETP